MPLRFDQPSLLGEWKGDPAIIHQALSQMHSASEGEKNRANTKAIADAELKAKKPSFKISNVKSPFSKDQEQIGGRVNAMLDPSISEDQRQLLDQQNLQQAAIAKAQEKQFTGLQQNLTHLQQKWGKNADFTKFNELENKIRTEDDISTRDKNLTEFGALQSRPEDYVNGDGLVIDFHKNMKETPLTYKEDIEKGGRTESKDFTITTKYPTKGEALLNPDGSQLVIDGNPQFKSREPRSPQELLPYANDLLNSDDDVRKVIYTQTYRKNKDKIESNTKSWAKNMELSGQKPTEEEMQSYMDGQTEKLAKESVATTLFNNDRARIEGMRKVSLAEPKQSTGGQKDAVAAVLDEAVNTNTNVGGVEKRQSIYRPNAIVLTNSKPQNYNLSGDVINVDDNSRAKFTGSTNATFGTLYTRMKIGDKNFIFEAEDKDGNKLPPPTHEKIMQIIRNTPIGTKIESDVHGIMDIVTKDNTKGVMSQEQIARLEELKKWEKLHPESPRIKDNTENAKKRSELYKLRSETQNPNQTVSAEAVNSGNLFRAFGEKTIEEGARSKKLPPEVRQRFANILEQQKAIEEHNSRVQSKQTPPVANKKQAPHGDRVSQGGKIYVWNGSEYVEE